MENERKNTSTENTADISHKGNRKNRHHKPKPYYVTPVDQKTNESAQSKPQSVQQTQSKSQQTQQVPQAQQPTASSNQANRNKRKHKKTHTRQSEKPIDKIQQNTASEAAEDMQIRTPEFSRSDRLEAPAPKKLGSFSSSPDYEKYSDYEEYSYEEIYGNESKNIAKSVSDQNPTDPVEDNGSNEESSENMVEVVGIKFKSSGKTYYFEPGDIKAHVGSHAIVKTARGLEYGEVALANTFVKESDTVPPLRPLVRIATDADIKHHAENKEKEDQAFRICNEKIIDHELDMKLIDAQYTFDNSKLLFYFTSSGRVDFRDLVKDLASVFRTRIELRQIGIRDEAKMVGGLGLCGRPLCCSIFLTDFGQVSIKMAKEQNLSLNSSKISGICGRLMCCLRYEYEAYDYEIKHTPPVDSLVRTVDGVGTVTEISPLAGNIKVKLSSQPDIPPKTYKREDVTILRKKKDSIQ